MTSIFRAAEVFIDTIPNVFILCSLFCEYKQARGYIPCNFRKLSYLKTIRLK